MSMQDLEITISASKSFLGAALTNSLEMLSGIEVFSFIFPSKTSSAVTFIS